MKTLLFALCFALLAAVPAQAQQAFDFYGQADLPAAVGGDLSLYSEVFNPAPAGSTPIPLDFANYQYTLVITGLELLVDGANQSYGGGTIAIYEDNATIVDAVDAAASPAQADFTDGTMILMGEIPSFTRSDLGFIFSMAGVVNWTGGTRLSDLAPADWLDWRILSAASPGTVPQDGYDEVWDGKVEPQEPVVGTEESSVGGFKAHFRR